MNPKVQKLAMKLSDVKLAELLVKGGFDNPASIRKANDKDLKDVAGLKQADVKAIRDRLPKRS